MTVMIDEPRKTVAVIGASNHREKFGNRAVRAYHAEGYRVIPIHPSEPVIEGLQAFKSVLDVPGPIDVASFYVPPEVGERLIADVVAKGIREVWLNPGAESDALIERTRELGARPVVACSIVALGLNPHRL